MRIVLLGGPLDGKGMTVNSGLPVYDIPFPWSNIMPPETIERYRQHPIDKAMYEHESSRPYYLHHNKEKK